MKYNIDNLLDGFSLSNKIKNYEVKKVGKKSTICLVTLSNGFEVIGTSACVDERQFNKSIGAYFALKDALNKIEVLEGYLMQQEMYLKEKKSKKLTARKLCEMNSIKDCGINCGYPDNYNICKERWK